MVQCVANGHGRGAQVVVESWNNGSPTPEFNNAAQAWNHTFYWESMSPSPTGALRMTWSQVWCLQWAQ